MFGGVLAGSARVLLGLETGPFNRDLESSRRRFHRFARGMESDARRSSGIVRRSFRGIAGALGLTFGGASIAFGFAQAIRKTVEFDRAMRNVNSIAHLSEARFKAISKAVLGMAGDTGQAPSVLARGLYDIVSSGFQAASAVKILRVSAKAASAGLTDTTTAAKAINAALNAYHLGADKARYVSDVLFQTVNKGVLTFEELAQNMGDMVPAAAPLGVTLEEVGAAIATITLQGVPAAEAATRVKQVMLQLAKPSEALSKLLKENGFASGEAAIQALGFAGTIEMISKATGGGVTNTRALTPEIRALMGLVGITGKNLATYNRNLDAMKNASKGAGAAQRAFAEQSKSVGLQWDKTKAELEAAAITLASQLLPHLLRGARMLRRFAADLRANRGAAGQLRRTVASLAAAIARVARFVNRAVQAFGGWEPVLKAFFAFLVIRKVLQFAAAIRAIGLAAMFTQRRLGFLAATSFLPVGPVAGGPRGAPGKFGRPMPLPRAPGRAPLPIPGGLALLTIEAILSTPGASGAKEGQRRAIRKALLEGQLARAYPLLTDVAFRWQNGTATKEEIEVLRSIWNSTSDADFRRAERRLEKMGVKAPGGIRDASDRTDAGTTKPPKKKPPKKKPPPEPDDVPDAPPDPKDKPKPAGTSVKPISDLELKLARAQARGDEGAEERILRRMRRRVRRQIAVLEEIQKHKRLTARQRERLKELYGDLESLNAEIASLHEKNVEKERKGGGKWGGMLSDALKGVTAQLEEGGRDEGGDVISRADLERRKRERRYTLAEVRAMQFEWLTGLHGMTNEFGSNLWPGGGRDLGQIATHSTAQTSYLRDVVKELQKLRGTAAHPEAHYARTELSHTFGGFGGLT